MTTQYIQKANCETVLVDGDWMILHPEAFTITRVNAVGGFLWTLLQTAQTLPSLANAIHEKYGDVSRPVEHDICTFLSDMLECGLIEHVCE